MSYWTQRIRFHVVVGPLEHGLRVHCRQAANTESPAMHRDGYVQMKRASAVQQWEQWDVPSRSVRRLNPPRAIASSISKSVPLFTSCARRVYSESRLRQPRKALCDADADVFGTELATQNTLAQPRGTQNARRSAAYVRIAHVHRVRPGRCLALHGTDAPL
jgi:hypothetical protein